MERGLVIGKFMPVHKGHLALIEYAAGHCDELIVSMSYTSHDPIPARERFHWLAHLLKDKPHITTAMVRDDFDDESLPIQDRTRIWGDFIRKTYPAIDVIFSSEDYGQSFALNYGARHVLFDRERVAFDVSASRIRANPFKYWTYIPESVRPYFVRKICIYGPESVGKSSLTVRLAERYQTEFVPEVAREMITSNEFTVRDIVEIGLAHDRRVLEKLAIANKLLFCDTDVITTQIYSRHYLNVVPDELYKIEKHTRYDLYFLLDIDVPWVPDGLRDLGDFRDTMMTTFRRELENKNIPFVLVRGGYEERERIVVDEINRRYFND